MTTQTERLTALAQGIAASIKALTTNQGNLAALSTTDKSSLVAAINELKGLIAASSSVLDTAVAGDTTHTWSADRIIAAIAQAKADLTDGAPGALDTLHEIATALTGDQSAISGLLDAVANRVRWDTAQSLTSPQQAQARANIGALSTVEIGDPTTDLLAIYTAAKA